MGEFEDFLGKLLDAHIPVFQREVSSGGITFDLGPRREPMTWRPLTRRDEVFVQHLIEEFAEIHDSYERLRDVEVYVGRFPFARSRVDKVRFLRFAVEAWLHELYMLRERLYRFAKFLHRAYRKDARWRQVSDAASAMRELARHALDEVARMRDAHVHESRFSDPDIRQLSFLLIIASRAPEHQWLFEMTYANTRQQKRAWVHRNNDSVEELLNRFFSIVLPLTFNSDGQLMPPTPLERN